MAQDHEIHRVTPFSAHAHVGNDERCANPEALADALSSVRRYFDAIEGGRGRLRERLDGSCFLFGLNEVAPAGWNDAAS